MKVELKAPKTLYGEVKVPGDKSISHRAVIFNSLAQGEAVIGNFGLNADTQATINCLKALGVRVEVGDKVIVYGSGGRLKEPVDVLNAQNSGTTLRLLSGLLAAQPFLSVITGDSSLRSRPVDRVVNPLRLMGARIWARSNDNYPPIVILGGNLRGIDYRLPVPSAQVKSALLLAGLFASSNTVIEEPIPTRDHSERLLKRMGAGISREGNFIFVKPLTHPLAPLSLTVPGDLSGAAYFLVAAAIHPQAKITVKGVGVNPTRNGIIEVLKEMRANLRLENQRDECGEPVADITVESSRLKPINLGGEIIPRLIDEIPVLAIAALSAPGVSVIREAGELRVKESDRIANLVRELTRLGAKIEELPDGMIIKGGSRLKGGEVKSYGDHRLAMALAVAFLLSSEGVRICRAEAVSVSYPNFWEEWFRLAQRG